MIREDEVNALEELFQQVSGAFDADHEDYTAEARDLFRSKLTGDSDDAIVPLGTDHPKVYREPTDDLAAYDHGYDRVYGIDASVTQPVKYQSGLSMSAALSRCSTTGDQHRDLTDPGHIVAVGYFHDWSSVNLEDDSFSTSLADVTLELLDETEVEGTPYEWIRLLARTLAEGRHGQEVAKRIDGPLLRDGSIYPMSLFSKVSFAPTAQRASTKLASTENIQKSAEAVQAYINTISNAVEQGHPVCGIVKTMSSDALVSIVQNGESVRWSDDEQFMRDVLFDRSNTHLTFTSWLVQQHQSYQESVGEQRQTVEGFKLLADRSAEDYQRAFYFVRLPRMGPTGSVLRVEAPRMLVDTPEDRRHIQQFTLREIAMYEDTALAIKQADDAARIPTDTTNHLAQIITGTERVQDYNDYRRNNWGMNDD